MLVSRHERKLAEGDGQTIAKLFMHLFEYRVKHAARRTLEISKLFELDRRIRWSKHMRGLGARNALGGRRLLLCYR